MSKCWSVTHSLWYFARRSDGAPMPTNLAVAIPAATTRRHHRSTFFIAAAITLLVIVVVGFTPTLFLRALFDVPARPLYLYCHGAILSGWFVWLVVQAGLVWSGRTSTHRRTGWVGAAFGAVVVISSLMATLGLIPNLRGEGVNLDDPLPFVVIALDGSPFSSWIGFTSWVVWTNVVNILTFAGCLIAAILLRRRIEVHKRLMLLASISIIGPPLARISRWPVFGGYEDARIPFAGLVILISALAVHDLVRSRRIHPATAVAGIICIASTAAASIFASSGVAQTLIRSLR
jgi:hypothetical protein